MMDINTPFTLYYEGRGWLCTSFNRHIYLHVGVCPEEEFDQEKFFDKKEDAAMWHALEDI